MPIATVTVDSEHTLLYNAIESCSIERLRLTLREICQNSEDAFRLACNALLLGKGELKKATEPKKEERKKTTDFAENTDNGYEEGEEYKAGIEESEYSDASASEPLDAPQGQKRKRACTRQRYEMCGQCETEYDVLDNNTESCVWHEGELELKDDSSIWDEWDENIWGELDTDDNRVEYPKGFAWTCCEWSGDKKGCKQSIHRPDRTKRARVWGPKTPKISASTRNPHGIGSKAMTLNF
ncbi:uncharacterized protein BDR25DRAFT_344111 [Lindgomyces ingoldianus]|uniref:Uncharacterized protein n=1 Tax=Lindgomyces ingoldianus TaxID=673940 RepID=A0ACB6QPG5_9PLEO|nr:uncharacterized protein BDR25DRAFT_344111 [Lindgomyces ingoldianus]KAF2468883.1 hypothetical protein BDR25DRAFT_344111 [Lindgomyces ingoldianus]